MYKIIVKVMPCGKPTSEFIKGGQVVVLRKDGKSFREIAKTVKLSKSTVMDVWRKYERTRSCDNDELLAELEPQTPCKIELLSG
jgi:transposase